MYTSNNNLKTNKLLSSRIYFTRADNPRSQRNQPKNQQGIQMNQSKYNDPQSRSSRYARPSSRTLKCDKLDPDEFFNCADINGKLYRLYNLFEDIEASEAFKKQQPKQIKRLNTESAKSLQSRMSQKDAKRPRGRPKKNANSTLINPDYPKKNAMEMGEKQESPKTISKKVIPQSKLDYLEDMELGAAFRKQQLPSSRRSLGVAGPRRPGRSPKGSTNCSTGSSVVDWRKLDEPSVVIRRSARIQAAKLRKQQSLERNLRKDQEKPNSGMVVDWEKLDKPERVQEPPIVLRRSARIQAAKLKKEALEASLRNQNQNQEKPSSRKAASDHVL
ncbi:uncharacterized protein LOC122612093 isoform X2 [Drosophila teissieri]|uniref:uncharacterized protein LOC122612093 isoform X2 n=1 Tax=Drosophila teissieri TaxID=7243 RepID=UPI001CBA5B9E|nr:uncharacterized protein LOC122612093 isoform X2 [Drosophila teissieri]